MDTADYLDAARATARAAAALLATARPHDVRGKGNPRDLITEWDTRSEALIRAELAVRAPGIPILGEEGGQDTGGADGAGLRWVVDPIDGTVNFAHGLPIWAVSIALGWWFEASAGGGAHDASGAPLAVTAQPRLDHALLSTGFPYDRATSPDNNFAEFVHLQRKAGACRRLGAASLDLCFVACGWIDGYWEKKLKAWDVAAAALIVREAGGTVTDLIGGRFDSHAGEVCASNGAIHDQLIAELGRAGVAS